MRRPAALNLRATIRSAILSLFVVLLVPACSDGDGPPELVPTVTGTVTNSATGGPVAGAEVRIGDVATTTGANGRFELTDLTTGTATLRCTAPAFVDFEADITVTSGSVTRDIGLARIEIAGVYDLTALVTSSGPVGSINTEGTRQTAVLTIQHSPGTPQFGGTFADFRAIGPGVDFFLGNPGIVSGIIDVDGHVLIGLGFEGSQTSFYWNGEGMLTSRQIVGQFGEGGHISGTFTAERRQAE